MIIPFNKEFAMTKQEAKISLEVFFLYERFITHSMFNFVLPEWLWAARKHFKDDEIKKIREYIFTMELK